MKHELCEAIIWAKTDNGQVEIESSPAGLLKLARSINSVPCELELKRLTADEVSPWLRSLELLKISDRLEKVSITIQDNALVVCGNDRSRLILSDNIHHFVTHKIKGSSDHLHFDYYPEHPFIAEGSISVIISAIG